MKMQNREGICRLCMETSKLTSIFKMQEGIRLDVKAMACTHVKIQQNDNLPSSICYHCESNLQKFYDFKVKCEETEKKLIEVAKTESCNEKVEVKYEPLDIEIAVEQIKKEIDKIKSEDECSNDGIDSNFELLPNVNSEADNSHIFEEKKGIKKFNIRRRGKKINENIDSSNKLGKHRKLGKINISHELIQKTTTTSKEFFLKERIWKSDKIFDNLPKPAKPFQCEYCGRFFKLKSVLKKHCVTHSNEKLFGCPICPKRYTRAEHRVVHMRSHTGIRPYICEICARSFTKNQDLSRHMRIHSDEKKYPCPRCDRKFKRSADVHTHMRTHTGVRPYACKSCSKSYTSHSGLRKHNRTKCKPSESDVIVV